MYSDMYHILLTRSLLLSKYLPPPEAHDGAQRAVCMKDSI